jgi:antirestriction protein ArdC
MPTKRHHGRSTPRPAAEQQEPRIKVLAQAHKKMADMGVFEGVAVKEELAILARMHSYSEVNNHLIWMQCKERGLMPDDWTDLRGYRVWQAAGRQVRQGEKAIWIFAPIAHREKQEDGTTEEKQPSHFKGATIFDISQTDPIPPTADAAEDITPIA